MKNKRQQGLLHVIQTRNVGSQEELQAIMKGRGFDVNVATISRDLRELGIVKASLTHKNGRSSFQYVQQSNGTGSASALHRAVSDFVESMSNADNFLVIKTRPRCALLVGSEIDKAGWREVLGTIAGDDTIIGICQSKFAAQKTIKRLKSLGTSSGVRSGKL